MIVLTLMIESPVLDARDMSAKASVNEYLPQNLQEKRCIDTDPDNILLAHLASLPRKIAY